MIPVRLIAAGAALAVAAGGIWYYGHGRYKAGYGAAEAVWQAQVREAGDRFAAALAEQQNRLVAADAALTEARRGARRAMESLDDALRTPEGMDWGAQPLPAGVRLSLGANDRPVPGHPGEPH